MNYLDNLHVMASVMILTLELELVGSIERVVTQNRVIPGLSSRYDRLKAIWKAVLGLGTTTKLGSIKINRSVAKALLTLVTKS